MLADGASRLPRWADAVRGGLTLLEPLPPGTNSRASRT